MPICRKCGEKFSLRPIVDGKRRNLCNRKFCLDCSPLGKHNTKNLVRSKEPKCNKCGETDPTKFYGKKTHVCGPCQNAYNTQRTRAMKEKAVEYLGGKCIVCGYGEFICSLEFHHLIPEEKDENFRQMKEWAWDRQMKELDKCALLCSNCHHAFHAGYITLPT